MKNYIELAKKHIWKILAIVFAILFLSKGCTFNKINSLSNRSKSIEEKIESLEKKIYSVSTKKEVRDEMERVMLDYLIYEDDLDKGKTSISNIKNKIESND
jgi:hypothetical protein